MSGKTNKPKKKRLTAEEREEERNFLRRCIETFRSMPVLWKIKSEEYMDREKKTQALQILLKVYQERYPEATIESVKNKFNSLRTNFRKELNKLNASKKSGMGRKESYVPTCWYFDDMYFIVDQETPAESVNTLENEDTELNEERDISQFMEESTMEQPHSLEFQPLVTSARKKKKLEDPSDELLRLAVHRLQQSTADDKNLYAAISWAKEISAMEPTQQVLAKKFINDIIFEGQMNALHRNSVVLNQHDGIVCPKHLHHHSSNYKNE